MFQCSVVYVGFHMWNICRYSCDKHVCSMIVAYTVAQPCLHTYIHPHCMKIALSLASDAADLLADQMLIHAVMVGSPDNK